MDKIKVEESFFRFGDAYVVKIDKISNNLIVMELSNDVIYLIMVSNMKIIRTFPSRYTLMMSDHKNKLVLASDFSLILYDIKRNKFRNKLM